MDKDGFGFKLIHRSRQFYNSNFKESKLLAEIQADDKDWGVWLARANAFANKVGSCSYATMVKHGKKVSQSKAENLVKLKIFKNNANNSIVLHACNNQALKKPSFNKKVKGHISRIPNRVQGNRT